MITTELKRIISERLQEQAPLIQVLLGPRQVGKTTTAKVIFDAWTGPKVMATADSITPPNAEWIRFNWEQARLKGPGTLLIFDEIQKVERWSEAIKSLFDPERGTGRLKILLLGSSSLYLKKGLGESLAGRFELLHAPHWSLADFQQEFGWDFDRFVRFGAYPGAAPFADDEARWRDYIRQSIIEPVISRDILGVSSVTKPALFRQTFELAVQHPAQTLSLQKMLGQLQDRGNVSTIKHYLEILEQCFLIRTLQKYSGSAVQVRASIPKIVVLNPALTHAYESQSRLSDSVWYGRVFESMIGAHLSRAAGCELYYWREGNLEIDYVLKTPKGVIGIEIGVREKPMRHKGMQAFSKRFPKAQVMMWNLEQGIEYLKSDPSSIL